MGLLFTLTIQATNKSDKAIVVRPASLKEKASFSAKTLKQMGLGYQVLILSKQGGWILVEGTQDKRRGWLRSYQIRSNIDKKTFQSVQQKTSGNAVANFARDTSALLNSPKKQNKNKGVVATIGIRGLSEQELKQAKPNPTELKRMQSYASNRKLAKQFARQGNLKVVK